MTQSAKTAVVPSTNAGLPPLPRLGAAIASAVVTCTLLGGVVLGMAATAPDGGRIVAQNPYAPRT